MVIYKTTNSINGKYYIGKQVAYTKSYLGSGTALKNAIKKYGKDNFTKSILEECSSQKELQTRELWWLDKTSAVTDKKSYNLVRETSANKHRSYDDPEYRRKMSASLKKTLNTEESKRRLRIQNGGKNNPMYGKQRPESFKQLVSKTHTGKIVSEKTKEKLRIIRTGSKMPDIFKEKMKQAQRKRWNTIKVECNLFSKKYQFDNRYDFIDFIKKYNDKIPRGKVRGSDEKRINWKKAIKNNYPFIKTTTK